MRKIRAMIVDDAVVIRRLVTDVLSADPDIEVVGASSNGRLALSRIPQVNPDVVVLDVEMPEMDGLETLAEIRKIYPRLPVIMFSTLTQRGAASTLEALARGATDYVTKPANVGSVSAGMVAVRESLLPKIKTFCGLGAGLRPAAARSAPAAPPLPLNPPPTSGAPMQRSTPPGRVDVVAIGCSTGGPNALAEVLPLLPAGFPVPVVVVQHMPPMFTRLLAERLNTRCGLTVAEGAQGGPVEPGRIWIAPGDLHMGLDRSLDGTVRLKTFVAPPENSCRPAVDVLFRSVAEVYGANTLAVVLTGMGQDGLRGCERIREAGGQVLTQDEATSVVWGMPGFVTRAGLADRVLSLDRVGHEIVERCRVGRARPSSFFSNLVQAGGAR